MTRKKNEAKAKILITSNESSTDLEKTVKRLGHTAIANPAATVKALEAVERQRPDVILADINLKACAEAAEWLKAADAIWDKWGIPLVFLTKEEIVRGFENIGPAYPFVSGKNDLEIVLKMAIHVSEAESERRIAESKAAFFSMIAEQSDDGIIGTDEKFHITYMNRAAKKLFGCRPDDIRGMTPAIFDADPEPNVSQQKINKAISDGKSFSKELLIRSKDGGAFTCHLKISRLKDGNGIVSGYMFSYRNITEHKRVENALAASEKNFSDMLNNIDHLAVILNVDGSVKYGNPFLLDLLGWSEEELYGKNWFQTCLPPDCRNEVEDVFRTIINIGEIPPHFENEIQTRDGKKRLIRWNNTLLHDHFGHLNGTASVGEDITERRQAEDALRESENKFKSFSEQSLVGVYLIQDGVFKYVNPKFAEMFGYTAGEFMNNMPFKNLVFPGDLNIVEEQVGKRISGEIESSQYTFTGLKKNREIFDVEIYGTSISYQGRSAAIGTILDITERKRMEKALKESEEKYRTTLRSTPDTVAISRVADGIFLELNDGFTRMFGYSRKEALGKSVPELGLYFESKDRSRLIDELTTKEEVNELEFTYRRKDGTLFEGLQSARPIRYGDEDCLISVVKDISSLKKTQKALRESGKILQLFMDAVPQSAFLMNPKGIVLAANATTRHRMKLKDNELAGKNIYDFLPPDIAKTRREYAEQVVRTGRPANFEDTRNGIHFDNYIQPLCDESGNVARLAVLSVDITERKRAEEELRQSWERFRNLIEGSIQGILVHRKHKPLFVNKKWAHIHGYTPDEVYHMDSVVQLISPKDRQRLIDYKNARMRGGNVPASYEYQGIRKDGSTVWLENRVMIVQWDGQPAIQTIIVNISDRKRAEEDLRQSHEDLQLAQIQLVQSAKLASIGELASGVAHELNQPLMVIRALAQFLLRKIKSGALEKDSLKDKMDSIVKNTKRMMNIIDHLRTFSRQTPMESTALDINEVIHDSFMMMGEQLRLRNILVRRDLSPDLPMVLGNANHLEQVVLNLLTNARDALESKAGSLAETDGCSFEITIATSLPTDRKDTVDVIVKDNGCGIHHEKLNKIFDPFYTTKDVGKGTGLGLSISYGIIQDHGGEIDVLETGPEGTTFRIRLPVAKQAP